MRMDNMMSLFSSDLRVTRLETGAVVTKGASKIKKSMAELGASKCEPSKRILIESDGADDPTLCLDMYEEAAAPGFGPKGLSSDCVDGAVVLYRVKGNQINHVWVAEDEDMLAANPKITKAGVTASDVWEKVVAVVKDSMTGAPVCHFSNYSQTEDTSGLGIGTTTKIVTFKL